jgi:hypothetical protein
MASGDALVKAVGTEDKTLLAHAEGAAPKTVDAVDKMPLPRAGARTGLGTGVVRAQGRPCVPLAANPGRPPFRSHPAGDTSPFAPASKRRRPPVVTATSMSARWRSAAMSLQSPMRCKGACSSRSRAARSLRGRWRPKAILT